MQFAITLMMIALTSTACAAGLWVKGNTHTHTDRSDGDSPPEVVVEWYKSRGYNFLVLSDHNRLTDPAEFDTDASDSFILIPGDEVGADAFKRPVHINGIGIDRGLKFEVGKTIPDTIQRNVDAILAAGGLPHVNHPNFGYALTYHDLAQMERCNLMEIYNGHPSVNNSGNAAHPSVEQVWDILLSAGKDIYGIASDDAHHFREFSASRANPGRGWVVVQVDKLTAADVIEGLRQGRFYASTGVELADYSVNSSAIRVSVKPDSKVSYVTRFIGVHGQILQETEGRLAIYRFTGKPCEGYVRAKVIASDGSVAWTQPVRRSDPRQ